MADQELRPAGGAVHSLRNLLEQRRSSSVLWNPLAVEDLRQVLSLALSRPPQRPRSRPYPTSGGCDELGILIAARQVEGLPEGAYWAVTDADGLFIHALPFSPAFAEFERHAYPFLGLSPTRPPAASLLILADWRRLSARYENCVLASALWDCGALLQTLSLAAAAVGANARICACVQPLLIQEWLGLDCRQVGQIGMLALGGTNSQRPTREARW